MIRKMSSFVIHDEKELENYKPRVVIVDDNNDIETIADSI